MSADDLTLIVGNLKLRRSNTANASRRGTRWWWWCTNPILLVLCRLMVIFTLKNYSYFLYIGKGVWKHCTSLSDTSFDWRTLTYFMLLFMERQCWQNVRLWFLNCVCSVVFKCVIPSLQPRLGSHSRRCCNCLFFMWLVTPAPPGHMSETGFNGYIGHWSLDCVCLVAATVDYTGGREIAVFG